MPDALQSILDAVVADLQAALGDNLYSCCLYGSAVRGNFQPKSSDLNLLIILERSDTPAHQALAKVLASHRQVDPFILARPHLERSLHAFASKFGSIQRHYRVLHGADVLQGF